MSYESDESDILCYCCGSGRSERPNEIVICDVCNRGWHQKCHKPKITEDIIEDEDTPWHCRLCVYALGSKNSLELEIEEDALVESDKGCASPRSPKKVATSLPYELSKLTWDAEHHTNRENMYCYCGKPGQFHSKMLQCMTCLQWFHEGEYRVTFMVSWLTVCR